MPTLTAVLMYEEGRQSGALAESLAASPAVTRLVLIGREAAEPTGLSARLSTRQHTR